MYGYIYIYTHIHTHTHIYTHTIHTHTYYIGFPGGTRGKELACQCRLDVRDAARSLGWEDPLGEDMATDSSILV